jgi:hypothetical protein
MTTESALTQAREALSSLDARLKECALDPISAAEAYDSFYSETTAEAIAAIDAARTAQAAPSEPVAWIVTRLRRRDNEESGRVRYLHLSEQAARDDFDGWTDVPGSSPTIAALYAAPPPPAAAPAVAVEPQERVSAAWNTIRREAAKLADGKPFAELLLAVDDYLLIAPAQPAPQRQEDA